MNSKTISIVAYLTIIGWVIAYLQNKKVKEKSPLAAYHLEQGLGIIIFALILAIAFNILSMVSPALVGILSVLGLAPLILMIFGMIAANNEALKPVPLIGKFFEGKFGFSGN